MPQPWRIDVHQHLISKEQKARAGVDSIAGGPLPAVSRDEALRNMDANEILAVVHSAPFPIGPIAGRELARVINDGSADLISGHPSRFGALAALPLPDVDASLKELEYALDTLGLDGVCLVSNAAGTYLGDPALDELFAELDRRRVTVFIHPNLPPLKPPFSLIPPQAWLPLIRTVGKLQSAPGAGEVLRRLGERRKKRLPGYLVEFVFDTTRAVASMLFNGTFERFPRINYILAHAGGTTPYLLGRLSHLDQLVPESVPKGVAHYLGSLHYDLAVAANSHAVASLRTVVGDDKIVFGSDYPLDPDADRSVQRCDALPMLDAAARTAIGRDNALRLFPRLAKVLGSPASSAG